MHSRKVEFDMDYLRLTSILQAMIGSHGVFKNTPTVQTITCDTKSFFQLIQIKTGFKMNLASIFIHSGDQLSLDKS